MINVKPCIPVVKESTPEAVKNILLHWHLVKGDKYIAWKNGKLCKQGDKACRAIL